MTDYLTDPGVSFDTTAAPTSDGHGGFTYSSSAWSLPNNSVVIVFVTVRDGNSLTVGNSPSFITHGSLDLVQIANAVRTVGGDMRIETWAAINNTGSAINAATVATFTETKTGAHVHIAQLSGGGVDLSQGVASLFIGYGTSGGGGGTSLSLTTLSPFDSGNRTLAHVAHRAAEAVTPSGGANTVFGSGSFAGPSSGAESAYYTGAFVTTPGGTWVTGAVAGMVAVEFRVTQADTRAPAFGPGTPVYRFRSGSPWERPLGANPPVHSDNANLLKELNGHILVNGLAADDHPFASNIVDTTIVSDLDAVTNPATVTVASTANFPITPFPIKIGTGGSGEQMTVTSVVGTICTVKRTHILKAHDHTVSSQNKFRYGKAYLQLNGGADGATDTKSFDEPIYRASDSDPLIVFHPKNEAPDFGTTWTGSVGNISPRLGTSGGGVHLPAIAKTYFNAEASGLNSDAPMALINQNGGDPFIAWISECHYYPSQDKWYCQGASIYFYHTYGVDAKDDPVWPALLPGTGLDPHVYQDSPTNGGNDGHRGVNSQASCVDWYQLVQNGGIFYLMECFLERSLDTNSSVHNFPMTGNERNKGGYIKEGIRFHIKNSVDVNARLTAAGLTGVRLQEAILLASALQDFGLLGGDNSGSGCNLKLENTIREGVGNQWSILSADMKYFPFIDDWEFIEDNYDPPVPASSGTTLPSPSGEGTHHRIPGQHHKRRRSGPSNVR